METLIKFDEELFLSLNSIHNQTFDFIMYWVTNTFIWIPLYLLFIVLIIKKFKTRSFLALLSIAFLILIVDQATSSLMKPFFERLRPCHQETISSFTHLVTHCGGQYSFVSGHAANSFSIATFLYLIFNDRNWAWLFVWAAIVSYSRIYVGVHFPLDVLAGAIVGGSMAILVYKMYQMLNYRIFKPL